MISSFTIREFRANINISSLKCTFTVTGSRVVFIPCTRNDCKTKAQNDTIQIKTEPANHSEVPASQNQNEGIQYISQWIDVLISNLSVVIEDTILSFKQEEGETFLPYIDLSIIKINYFNSSLGADWSGNPDLKKSVQSLSLTHVLQSNKKVRLFFGFVNNSSPYSHR